MCTNPQFCLSDSTHLVTLNILGSSLGSRKQYDTPLNVVPTSKDIIRRLVEPRYRLVEVAGIVDRAVCRCEPSSSSSATVRDRRARAGRGC